MTNFTIPKIEDAHPPFAALLKRNLELNDNIASLRRDAADLRQQLSEGDLVRRDDRIKALAAGEPYADQGPIKERLADVLRNLRDAEDALSIVTDRMREERAVGSRLVSQTFAGAHQAMLSQFWSGIALAAAASLDIHELHRQLHRSGIEPLGLFNPDSGVFDEAIARSSSTASKLRHAAKEGLIESRLIPEPLR